MDDERDQDESSRGTNATTVEDNSTEFQGSGVETKFLQLSFQYHCSINVFLFFTSQLPAGPPDEELRCPAVFYITLYYVLSPPLSR